jgi:hypothetical protein
MEMTSATAARDVAEQVVELLADRVPDAVLERMLLALAEGDRGDSVELRALLKQGIVAAALEETWPATRDYCLFGIRADQPATLQSCLAMRALAYRRTTLHCQLGGTLWLLGPAGDVAWVTDALQRSTMPRCLALYKPLADLRLAPSVCTTLEDMLDLGWRRGWTGVTHTAEIAAARRLDALLELAARQPELLEGRLARLTGHPPNHVFAETLACWFAHNQDTAATATAMHLHHNTVRYRLRRAQELTEVDLTDWDERLLAELHLRRWHQARSGSAPGELASARAPKGSAR